jgi:prefoldin subunit 5
MKSTHTTTFRAAAGSLLILALSPLLGAQEKAPAKPIDMEARKRSIVNLERHIGERQERIDELAQDMITLDKRVEKRIDRLVEILKKSKDSTGSKVSVAMTKSKAIDGLKKTIEYYDEKRRTLREELRKETTIPRKTLEGDVKKFDDRVEKRVEQIINLTKSFTESKDLEKYDQHTRSNRGWSWNESRISDDWRQNNSDARRTKLEKKDQLEALEKSMASLGSRNAWLKSQIDGKDASKEERDLFKKDLERNEEIIMTRQYQIDRLHTTGDQPEPKAVSRESAYELADLLDDTAEDVRGDFFSIFAKYAELNKERAQIEKLTKNLEARKKWMAENASE